MPHKFNAARRHKFDKAQYRVINWAEYNESLRQRGDLTIWVSEEAQSVWSAPVSEEDTGMTTADPQAKTIDGRARTVRELLDRPGTPSTSTSVSTPGRSGRSGS